MVVKLTEHEKKKEILKWEEILENEGFGIIERDINNGKVNDTIENVKKNISQKLPIINFDNPLKTIINNIEQKRKIRVIIDDSTQNIKIIDFKGTTIGEMGPGIIRSCFFVDELTNNHFFIEINEEYQRQGYGTILLKLYEKLSKEDKSTFYMSGTEYKKKPKGILLYLSNGYRLVSKIKNGMESDLYPDEIEEIIEKFKNPEITSYDVSDCIYKMEKEY